MPIPLHPFQAVWYASWEGRSRTRQIIRFDGVELEKKEDEWQMLRAFGNMKPLVGRFTCAAKGCWNRAGTEFVMNNTRMAFLCTECACRHDQNTLDMGSVLTGGRGAPWPSGFNKDDLRVTRGVTENMTGEVIPDPFDGDLMQPVAKEPEDDEKVEKRSPFDRTRHLEL